MIFGNELATAFGKSTAFLQPLIFELCKQKKEAYPCFCWNWLLSTLQNPLWKWDSLPSISTTLCGSQKIL